MNTKEMNMISGLKVSLIKICRSSDNLRGSRTVMDAFAMHTVALVFARFFSAERSLPNCLQHNCL